MIRTKKILRLLAMLRWKKIILKQRSILILILR